MFDHRKMDVCGRCPNVPGMKRQVLRGRSKIDFRCQAEGQIFAAPASDPEHPEAVELEMVLFQPEADGALVRCDYDRLQRHDT